MSLGTTSRWCRLRSTTGYMLLSLTGCKFSDECHSNAQLWIGNREPMHVEDPKWGIYRASMK